MRRSTRIESKKMTTDQQKLDFEILKEKLAAHKDDLTLLEEFETEGKGKGVRVSKRLRLDNISDKSNLGS